jgi:CarD family transcriptional regulator
MYAVGDKVVHPGYGPGVIKGIERRQVIGDEKDYYIIEILTGDATLMTPVAQADKVGLRPALGAASIRQILELLTEAPETLSEDYRERQLDVDERLREGDVFVVARVMRDMAWYGHFNDMTKRDAQLMQRAEEIIAGELALVRGIEVKEALEDVQAILEEAINHEEDG